MPPSHGSGSNSGLKALPHSPPGTAVCTAEHNAAEPLAEEGICPKKKEMGKCS